MSAYDAITQEVVPRVKEHTTAVCAYDTITQEVKKAATSVSNVADKRAFILSGLLSKSETLAKVRTNRDFHKQFRISFYLQR